MADEAKCPKCGEKGSLIEVGIIDRKTGKPLWRHASFFSKVLVVAGGLFILIGIMFIVLFIINTFFSETTSDRPIGLCDVISILFFAGCPLGFGLYLTLTLSAFSAKIIKLYRFKCSQCKKKWDQWQTEGWEQVQCPNCGGFKVILLSLMVDPSGKSVKVDTLVIGLLGSLCSLFIIFVGIWTSRVSLPPGGRRESPCVMVGFGFLLLYWSLPMVVKYLRRKKKLTYVCFECDREWLHEGKTK